MAETIAPNAEACTRIDVLARATLFHAFILSGGEQQCAAAALRLAQTYVCDQNGQTIADGGAPCGGCSHCRKAAAGSHPDITTWYRDGKEHFTVGQIRSICNLAALKPNEAARKVFIIADAGRMNVNAQNALLKQLEEPSGDSVFVLCADDASQLLPTVRSRCRELAMRAEAAAYTDDVADCAYAIATAAPDGDEWALFLACQRLEKLSREDQQAALSALLALVSAAAAHRTPSDGDDVAADKAVAIAALSRLQLKKLLRIADIIRTIIGQLEAYVNPSTAAAGLCAAIATNVI